MTYDISDDDRSLEGWLYRELIKYWPDIEFPRYEDIEIIWLT